MKEPSGLMRMRRLPLEVEAVQLTPANIEEVASWAGGTLWMETDPATEQPYLVGLIVNREPYQALSIPIGDFLVREPVEILDLKPDEPPVFRWFASSSLTLLRNFEEVR